MDPEEEVQPETPATRTLYNAPMSIRALAIWLLLKLQPEEIESLPITSAVTSWGREWTDSDLEWPQHFQSIVKMAQDCYEEGGLGDLKIACGARLKKAPVEIAAAKLLKEIGSVRRQLPRPKPFSVFEAAATSSLTGVSVQKQLADEMHYV